MAAQFNNMKSCALVDTGSTYTIVDVDFYHSIPLDRRPKLSEVDVTLTSADGNVMDVLGKR